jgi:hypothetical protein
MDMEEVTERSVTLEEATDACRKLITAIFKATTALEYVDGAKDVAEAWAMAEAVLYELEEACDPYMETVLWPPDDYVTTEVIAE